MTAAVEGKAEGRQARRSADHGRIDAPVLAHPVAAELVGGLLGHQQHIAIRAEAHLRRAGSAGGRQRLGAASHGLEGPALVAKAADVARAVGVEDDDHAIVLSHADGTQSTRVRGRAPFQTLPPNGEGRDAVARRVDDEEVAAVATERDGALIAQPAARAHASRGESAFQAERAAARRRIDQQLVAGSRIGAGEDAADAGLVIVVVGHRHCVETAKADDGQADAEKLEGMASGVIHRAAPLNE